MFCLDLCSPLWRDGKILCRESRETYTTNQKASSLHSWLVYLFWRLHNGWGLWNLNISNCHLMSSVLIYHNCFFFHNNQYNYTKWHVFFSFTHWSGPPFLPTACFSAYMLVIQISWLPLSWYTIQDSRVEKLCSKCSGCGCVCDWGLCVWEFISSLQTNHSLLFAFNVKEFISSFRANVGYL